MANGAGVNRALMALKPDALEIVPRRHGRRDCVWAVMADDALDSGMPDRIAIKHSRLLILMTRDVVTIAAARLIDPRRTIGISNCFHRPMARDARDVVGVVHIP